MSSRDRGLGQKEFAGWLRLSGLKNKPIFTDVSWVSCDPDVDAIIPVPTVFVAIEPCYKYIFSILPRLVNIQGQS